MEIKGLAMVFSVEEEKDGKKVSVGFVRDGKEITYADVSLRDKYNFCMTCKNMTGVLAKIILAENEAKKKENK